MSIQTTIAHAMKGNTISTTAIAISDAGWSWGANDLAQAQRARICCNTEGVVISWDGTNPTSSLGFPLAAGETVELVGNVNIQAVKMIRSGAADAAVTVILEKFGA